MRRLVLPLLAHAALSSALSSVVSMAQAQARVEVAITIDDLPWSGPPDADLPASAGHGKLLAALAAQHAVAAGFVNCGRVRGDTGVLRAWIAAGHTLGNHTSSHLSLDGAGASRWIDDMRACDSRLRAWLRAWSGTAPRFFRYPMLRQGATRARRDSAARALAARGYVNAHVSIDDADYLVAEAYRTVRIARNEAAADRIVALYLDHLRRAFRHARAVAVRKTGRETAQVLLLHASRLNAEQLPAVLRMLQQEGATFVPLERALADAVYARRDEYVGAKGVSWLYRIAPLDPADVTWDSAETARVERELAAIVGGR